MNFDLSVTLDRLQKLARDFMSHFPNFVFAFVVFLVILFLAKLIRTVVHRVTVRKARTRSAGLAVGRLAQGTVILIGILISLTIVLPSFAPADVIGFLGIGSVAIGFAFRDVLQNFLAGILILFTQPFRIGDQIQVKEYEGTVEDIQTRATFIRTYDGRRVVIPNAELLTEMVTVNTAFEKRRVEYDIGIAYSEDIDQAKSLILDAMRGVDIVVDDPAPDVLVRELAPSTVNLRARWWIEPPARFNVLDSRDKVLAAIKKTLQENGIDMPPPTYQIIHMNDQDRDTENRK